MYILIGADIVPTSSNMDLFINGDAEALLGQELCSLMKEADHRIFNLELPLTDKETPILKHGPNHMAPTASVAGLKAIGTDLFTLANNHILDQGEQGLLSTENALDSAGIAHFGTGTSETASAPYLLEFAGKTIGLYACTEHEFSLATKDRIGANPFDPLWSPDHVKELKDRTDFVIVLYHGGKEIYRYPTPRLQSVCRRLIDKGADLVICQHSHCIGCEEKYGGATIVYGQGNFLFDDDDSEFGKTALLIKIDDQLRISYIPTVKHESVVRLADENTGKRILSEFEARSEEARSEEFLQEHYNEIAQIYLPYYLSVSGGRESALFKMLDKLSHGRLRRYKNALKYKKTDMTALRNIIECEVHNELFIRGLSDLSDQKP